MNLINLYKPLSTTKFGSSSVQGLQCKVLEQKCYHCGGGTFWEVLVVHSGKSGFAFSLGHRCDNFKFAHRTITINMSRIILSRIQVRPRGPRLPGALPAHVLPGQRDVLELLPPPQRHHRRAVVIDKLATTTIVRCDLATASE